MSSPNDIVISECSRKACGRIAKEPLCNLRGFAAHSHRNNDRSWTSCLVNVVHSDLGSAA